MWARASRSCGSATASNHCSRLKTAIGWAAMKNFHVLSALICCCCRPSPVLQSPHSQQSRQRVRHPGRLRGRQRCHDLLQNFRPRQTPRPPRMADPARRTTIFCPISLRSLATTSSFLSTNAAQAAPQPSKTSPPTPSKIWWRTLKPCARRCTSVKSVCWGILTGACWLRPTR